MFLAKSVVIADGTTTLPLASTKYKESLGKKAIVPSPLSFTNLPSIIGNLLSVSILLKSTV